MNAVPSGVVKEIAPTGTLRAAINLRNPVLAQGTAEAPRGVTVELARELARRLGVTLELLPFYASGKVFDAARQGLWDVAFLAIEPIRSAEIAFTAPYIIIEGVYVVPIDSPLRSLDDVDRPGVRIAVNQGSAYDLFLTRTLKSAKLVRVPTSTVAFVDDRLDALAGVRQPMAAFMKTHPDTRMIDGRFMEVRQAMGTPRGRDVAAKYLEGFVEEMKASGFVADALKRSDQPDVTVAPPA